MTEIFRLPQGAIIQCSNPHCNAEIGRIQRDLKAGDPWRSEDIKGPRIRHGSRPICIECGHFWYIEEDGNTGRYLSRIHTAAGWFPDEDRIVEGMS